VNPKAHEEQEAAPATFEPLVQVRAHEYVAEQIRRHIQLHLSGPGEALPSERELARQFDVGRPTIQMALRLLEAERLIEARRGRGGGTFILDQADSDDARDDLIAGVARRRAELTELLDFRAAVEPEIAAAAARNRDAADLKRLRAALDELDQADEESAYMRWDTELHLALGAAAHNRFLNSAAEEIRYGLNTLITLLPESEIWQRRVGKEHHQLVDAVEQGKPDLAARIMRRHIGHTGEGALAVFAAIKRRELPR
jgi:GntR family transcriptional regulator, transcriptional repressor for pyruvate dehydrogenase complex